MSHFKPSPCRMLLLVSLAASTLLAACGSRRSGLPASKPFVFAEPGATVEVPFELTKADASQERRPVVLLSIGVDDSKFIDLARYRSIQVRLEVLKVDGSSKAGQCAQLDVIDVASTSGARRTLDCQPDGNVVHLSPFAHGNGEVYGNGETTLRMANFWPLGPGKYVARATSVESTPEMKGLPISLLISYQGPK